MDKKIEQYDVVIIGGGPAGLTAAIYCGRARLNTILIEQSLIGGLDTYTNEIENFPGFPEGCSGLGLMDLFHKQAKRFGVKFKLTDVRSVDLEGEVKKVETFRNVYETKTVIIASGGRPRVTKARDDEKYLFDKGISFCATCDAAANTGKTVMVIGSGDAAIEEGMFLTKFAKEVLVSVIHDEGKMDCNEIAKDAAMANQKMKFYWNTMVDSFAGEDHLDTVNLKHLKTGEIIPVKVDTCFEFIGYEPNSEIFQGKVKMSRRNYIITNENMETGIAGVFACGDVREKDLKQVATAVGDGAIAGVGAEKYIAETEMFENQIMQSEKVGLIYIYSAIDAPSREILPMMQDIENLYNGKVKLNVIDQYKGMSLCNRLACDVEPMTIFYTRNGKVTSLSDKCDKRTVLEELNKLVKNPIEVKV